MPDDARMHRGREMRAWLAVVLACVGAAGCLSSDDGENGAPTGGFMKKEEVDGGLDVECFGDYKAPDGKVSLYVTLYPNYSSSSRTDGLRVMCGASIVGGWRKSGTD